jgi:hypothetical protein
MDSVLDTAEAVGCPIRKSTDQSLLAAPHGLSQRAASFIASQCQGIHQMPFRRLISSALTRRVSRHIRMRHAQEKAHKELATSPQPHPAKMHHMTQPTVSSCEATALSGHPRSLILFTCQRSHTRLSGYLCSLSRISIRPGHRRSPFVTAPPPGGGGRDRTDDLMLAKHALSQLSYAPTGKDQVEQWWAREDLNFRPHAYQARALTN